jgi:glycerophosphoryl diester phosphodiesterase
MRPSIRRAAFAIVICAVVLSSGSVAVTMAGPATPKQFYRPFGQTMEAAPRPIMTVAHNAGDAAATARRAVRQGADVIEIDVLLWGGELRAEHRLPETRVSRLSWTIRPPDTLAAAWRAARSAPAIQIDVKDPAPALVPLLIDFLTKQRGEKSVIVSSPDQRTLDRVAAELPEVQRVLSIDNVCVLASTISNPTALQSLWGVSVRASLLDAETIAWFQDQGLFVLAWTIDDLSGLERVLGLNVDAVATNNLAIVEYLQRTAGEPGSAGAPRTRGLLLAY